MKKLLTIMTLATIIANTKCANNKNNETGKCPYIEKEDGRLYEDENGELVKFEELDRSLQLKYFKKTRKHYATKKKVSGLIKSHHRFHISGISTDCFEKFSDPENNKKLQKKLPFTTELGNNTKAKITYKDKDKDKDEYKVVIKLEHNKTRERKN